MECRDTLLEERLGDCGAHWKKRGPCPFQIKRCIGAIAETMETNVHPPSDKTQQRIYSSFKSYRMKHVLLFSLEGTIVDASICHPGSMQDYHCAEGVIERHKDVAYNPCKLGMVVGLPPHALLCSSCRGCGSGVSAHEQERLCAKMPRGGWQP